jgi:hypothetical protein
MTGASTWKRVPSVELEDLVDDLARLLAGDDPAARRAVGRAGAA